MVYAFKRLKKSKNIMQFAQFYHTDGFLSNIRKIYCNMVALYI